MKFTGTCSLTITEYNEPPNVVEPRFNEVAGDRSNLFVKWRVRYVENLDMTNMRENDPNVRFFGGS